MPDIQIVVSENGTQVIDQLTKTEYVFTASSGDSTYTVTREEDSTKTGYMLSYAFDVVNNPGAELPMTGGEGNMKYTVAGALLMLTGLCIGCALRRRERRFGF